MLLRRRNIVSCTTFSAEEVLPSPLFPQFLHGSIKLCRLQPGDRWVRSTGRPQKGRDVPRAPRDSLTSVGVIVDSGIHIPYTLAIRSLGSLIMVSRQPPNFSEGVRPQFRSLRTAKPEMRRMWAQGILGLYPTRNPAFGFLEGEL